MLAPTHVLFSLSSTLAIARICNVPISAPEVGLILIGSLLPDIDADGATITRPGMVLRRFLPYSLSQLLDGIASILARLINALFGHRGFTHAPALWIGLILWGAIAGRPYVFWLSLSALFHVAGDALTLSGVPLCFPISSKRYGLRLFRTGSIAESLLAVILLVYTVLLGFPLLPVETRQGIAQAWSFTRMQFKF